MADFMPHGQLLDSLNDAHSQAVAQWDNMKAAGQQLGVMRQELDKLTSLGDMVTADDVLKASGRLVAAGQSASKIAGLLADMPQDGPSLQQWVAMHDEMIAEREAAVKQMSEQARHQVAVTGLQTIHAYATMGEPQPGQATQGPGPVAPSANELQQPEQPSAPAGNALTGSA